MESSMADFGNGCPGKMSWPELKGGHAWVAETTIEQENPNVRGIILQDGTPVTKDFRCDRVWIWVNSSRIVVRTPRVG